MFGKNILGCLYICMFHEWLSSDWLNCRVNMHVYLLCQNVLELYHLLASRQIQCFTSNLIFILHIDRRILWIGHVAYDVCS